VKSNDLRARYVSTSVCMYSSIQQLFPESSHKNILLSLARLKSKAGILVSAEPKIPETRIFVSAPMFAISSAILTLLIVAILYYTHRSKNFLPWVPTSIASIAALVSAIQALQDFSKSDKRNENSDETLPESWI
jgi:hypothetical protein